jgi:hypothetical protein
MNSRASSVNAERGTMTAKVKSFSVHRSSFRTYRLILFVCLFMFAAIMTSAQEQPAAADESTDRSSITGKITGRIIGDDGRPLPDAVVYFFRTYARVPGPPQMAATDSDGKFQILNLQPGLYTVNASLPGFIAAPDAAIDTGEARYYRPGDYVTLTLIKGGVITGTVRDANGDAVVAVAVRATRVRDANGRTLPRVFAYAQPRMTDDRGIYRLYGLQPGTYIVSAGGNLGFFGVPNAYDSDAPTYFPSSTRDTAADVPVRGGEEATGTDIRYRGERGHTISGTISGVVELNGRYGVTVTLAQASSGAYESTTYVQPGMKPGFSFNGVADGEYELTAQQGAGLGDSAVSTPRRVTVKDSDITGIELLLAPLGSIAGRVLLDAAPKESCVEKRGATFVEILLGIRRDEKVPSQEAARTPFFLGSGNIPNDQGEFTIHNVQTGSYRMTVRLPSEAWYVRSITLPVAPSARVATKTAETKSASTSPVLTIKAYEHITGVTLNIAQDAAALRGRVIASTEGVPVPTNLKVYLVPAERERADDVLRYSEALLDSDGTFTLKNLAPGHYFLIARPAPEPDPSERSPRPLAWDTDARAKLRRDAEAATTPIELKPCQRASDYTLRYPNMR